MDPRVPWAACTGLRGRPRILPRWMKGLAQLSAAFGQQICPPPPPQTQALRRFHRCHTLSPPRPAPLQPVCGVCDGAFSHGRWGGGCRHPQVPSAPVACFLLLCVLGPRGSWLIGTPYQILREFWVISNESWVISRGSCAISPKSHLAATNTHTRQLSPFQCPGPQACGARVLACSSPGARIPVRSTLQS